MRREEYGVLALLVHPLDPLTQRIRIDDLELVEVSRVHAWRGVHKDVEGLVGGQVGRPRDLVPIDKDCDFILQKRL